MGYSRGRVLRVVSLFVGTVGLAAYAVVIANPCAGLWFREVLIISPRLCFYLRSPLVWLTPDRRLPTPQPVKLTPLPVPEGRDPGALADTRSASELLAETEALADENPGGVVGIVATWEEQYKQGEFLYITAPGQPFIGAFRLGVVNFPEPVALLLTCLLDFIQVPCEPDAPKVQRVTLESNQLLSVPIRLAGLTEGLHDLVVVVWQDISGSPADDYDARLIFYQKAVRVSIAAGGSAEPRDIRFQPMPMPFHVFGFGGIALSDRKHPWDPYGGFPPFTYVQAQPGDTLDLYLHVFNAYDFRLDYAISAFLDYEQVPLIYNGSPHVPLYVSAKAQGWYPLRVQVAAPVEVGNHELVILAESFPQARVDLERVVYPGVPLTLDLWSSNRVLMEVVHTGR